MTPPVRRRRGAGHELRDVVLTAATDLLGRTGDVSGLTMREVAAAAEVTPPSVYRHFPDKESLVRAVVSARFADYTAALRDAGSEDDPMRRLTAVAHAYVRLGLEQPGHYRVLFSATNAGPSGLGLDDGEEHPGAESFRLLVGAVADCLDDPGRAPVLATELWASLHGVVDLRITKPEMPWPDVGPLIEAALAAIRDARPRSTSATR